MNLAVAIRRPRAGLAALLLLGLLIRLPLMVTGYHADHDIELYIGWGQLSQARGLAQIYHGTKVDYPPVLLYLFEGATWLEAQFGQPGPPVFGANRLAALLIQLPTALADVVVAGLLAWVVGRRTPRAGLLAAGLYLFNPAIWYVTAYWGQTDSLYTLLLLAGVVALARRAVLPAWLLYALALGTKLQSLALAPLLIAWTLAKHGVRGLAGGLAVATLTEALVFAPWLLAGRGDDLIHVYTEALEQRVVVTAYNFWYLFLGPNFKVSAITQPTSLSLTYQDIGNGLFGLLALLIVGLALWRGAGLVVPAVALCLGMFLVVTEMHERHAFPALAFLAWGVAEETAARWGVQPVNRPPAGRWPVSGWIYGGLTLTVLFNLITILPFSPLLEPSLIVDAVDSPRWLILKGLSFVAAMLNILLLAGLIGLIGAGRERSQKEEAPAAAVIPNP